MMSIVRTRFGSDTLRGFEGEYGGVDWLEERDSQCIVLEIEGRRGEWRAGEEELEGEETREARGDRAKVVVVVADIVGGTQSHPFSLYNISQRTIAPFREHNWSFA